VILPKLLEPELLDDVLRVIEKADFVAKIEGEVGDEFGHVMHIPRDQPALFVFHLVLNRPEFFKIIEYIAECPPIGNFFGRIHRSQPDANHQIEWHGDNADHRMVGISINLSRVPYTGGEFQIRDKQSENITNEISNLGLGDAFLFGISPELQHRLKPVESGGNRTVGVGWFRSHPDWPTFSKGFFLPLSGGSASIRTS
jgi:hypothetical protein